MTENLPVETTGLESLAQAHEGEAFALLVETVRDTEAKREHRLKAAELIMDRARGKPKQPTQKDPSTSQRKQKAVSMSVDTLLKIVQKASTAVAHKDAITAQARVLEGEFVPVPKKRPVNEYAQVPAIVPATTPGAEVDELLS